MDIGLDTSVLIGHKTIFCVMINQNIYTKSCEVCNEIIIYDILETISSIAFYCLLQLTLVF